MDFDKRQLNQKHLNLFGKESNDPEEVAKIKAQAMEMWPVSVSAGCKEYEDVMVILDTEIQGCRDNKAANTSAGNQRVQQRYIDGYLLYQNDLLYRYSAMECAKMKTEALAQAQEDKKFEDAKMAKESEVSGSNLIKYIIFGVLSIVIIVAGVIVYKKIK